MPWFRVDFSSMLFNYSKYPCRSLLIYWIHRSSLFNETELSLLVSGSPTIDPSDWKAHTHYIGYTASDDVVQWFWQAVDGMTEVSV